MQPLPFIGRLHAYEFVTLVLSMVLIFVESIISIITLALPTPIIGFFYRGSRRAFNHLSSPAGRRSRNKKKNVSSPIAQAQDFVELCALYGYYAEEHIVQTGDGYLLGLHRLGWRKGEEHVRVNSGPDSLKKKVVYMHHGLLMNSDVWVCITEKERVLPFLLVEQGYDVWLGNNRGNKYSKKSINCSPADVKFWNFSMDQFAFHDIPDSVNYILETTHQSSLSYIGFSQGTAQAFAALSVSPPLNDKIDVFIALAPAMSPKGVFSSVVDTFVKASPNLLFLAFGRRAILGSATMWQAILYPPIFVRLIDMSLTFLFNWRGQNISPHQKLAAYPHLYSFTSTKSVVHWFQIMRNAKFQMYDDEVQGPLSFSTGGKYYKVAKFPTRNIKTPIVLVYGGSDSLVDINVMLQQLPAHTTAKEVSHYEHLDFLWASTVDKLVFPHVFQALDTYTDPEKRRTHQRLQPPAQLMNRPSFSAPYTTDEDAYDSPTSPLASRKFSENLPSISSRIPSTPTSTTDRVIASAKEPQSPAASHLTGKTAGWWSSDEIGGTDVERARESTPSPRPGSRGTPDHLKDNYGLKGISLGASRPVGGVSKGEVEIGVGAGSGAEGRKKKKAKKKEGD
ncbi:alpha/beta-hydrolase [Pseudovirgaria hyperparasitica]|uniref:Alpha/beta-hydrolase n=1 Tax=Pseudovirgaria hyperparasitica TaxID=470096 RepID=A0A6A6WA84_9PEZI|nr:alpha/beta-hydrolase [Pseudovirgaria hyperparasitica]KAF2758870.1 alpha/beta-hydrolase [Pseudovirgaria hyperparasitica]